MKNSTSSDSGTDTNSEASPLHGRAGFATTHWSVVVAAGNHASSSSQDALSRLCQSYWYPLYVFVRRRGYSASRAEDLTQSFFAHLIERNTIENVSPVGGRFRSFLLRAITNFLNNEHKYQAAQKRGGNVQHISIDFQEGEKQYAVEPRDTVTPDLLFERKWALATLEKAKTLLADEYLDRPKLFEEIRPFVAARDSLPKYSEIGARLGMTESAIKVAVHRLRKKFAEKLRLVIGETVNSTEEIPDEITYLMSVFRR